jgi:hypothetical protein
MNEMTDAQAVGAHNSGYLAGYGDAQEGKTAMTEAQLSYHGDEYAAAYPNGYAGGLKDTLLRAEAELSNLSAQTKEAYRQFRDLDAKQTAKADEIRELKRQIREAAK